ncbi:hypothetical protein P9112_003422 [Eukaryota sp. TZLM1-RC]
MSMCSKLDSECLMLMFVQPLSPS